MLVLPQVTEYFEYNEPVDHKALPINKTKKLMICILPPCQLMEPLFAESIMMPVKPIISPIKINLSEKLSFQCFLSRRMNQKGVVAIMMEHSPAGRYCSTQINEVVPKNNISIPASEFFVTDILSGTFSPLAMHHINKIIPAIKKRMAAIKNGGVLFIASAIAI